MAFRLTSVLRSNGTSKAAQLWAYNWAGFNRYGLYRDDLLDEYNPDVIEALRRIPGHVLDERQYRIMRASQLVIRAVLLPKDEWTRLEDDVLYLTPVVEQVIKERLEREKWDDEH